MAKIITQNNRIFTTGSINIESSGSHNIYVDGNLLAIFSGSKQVGINTTGLSSTLNVYSNITGSSLLNVEGTSGVLFNVTDDLSDSLASINNQSGLPVAEFFNSNKVVLGQFGQSDFIIDGNKTSIGTNVLNDNFKLLISGSVGPSSDNVFDLGHPSYRWKIVYGTASFASLAATASYISGAFSGSVTSSSYALTASHAVTSSYANNSDLLDGLDSKFFLTASNIGAGVLPVGRLTGSYNITSSWSVNSLTASVAISSSYALSSSYTLSGSYSLSSSYSSASTISATSSYQENAFIQNGNSFGTTAILGTNDNQNLRFETNGNTTRIIVSSGSATRIGIGSNPELAYTLTVLGHIGPQATDVYDLGATGSIWRTLYTNGISSSNITSNFIGNLTGSAQNAINAISASNSITSSYSLSSSYTTNADLLDGLDSKFFLTASNLGAGVIPVGRLTGSYLITSSWSINSLTASNSITSSYANNSELLDGLDSTYFLTASNLAAGVLPIGRLTGSYNITSSWALNSLTASNSLSSSHTISSSYASASTLSLTSSYQANAFIQGGNTFGATAILGTNDNQSLELETNGTRSVVIGTTGQIALGVMTLPTLSYVVTVGGHFGAANSNTSDIGATGSNWRTLYVTNISASNISASILFGNVIGSASYSTTSSYALSASHASGANFSVSSSYSLTSSYALSSSYSLSSSYATSASWVGNGTNNYIPKWLNNILTPTSSIFDNGRVGIGTNSPQAILHIVTNSAEIRLTSTVNGQDSYISFYSGSTGQWSLGFDCSDQDKFKIGNNTALGGSDAFTITTSSNSSIGLYKTSPVSFNNSSSTRLDVNGSVLFNNFALISNYGSDSNIDHLWHDDTLNTWHFNSDTTYQNNGNSRIYASHLIMSGSQTNYFKDKVSIGTSDENALLTINRVGNNINKTNLSASSVLIGTTVSGIGIDADEIIGSGANLTIGTIANTVTYDVIISPSGSDIARFKTNAGQAELRMSTVGDWDSVISFYTGSTGTWVVGYDNNDGRNFKIGNSGLLDINTAVTITSGSRLVGIGVSPSNTRLDVLSTGNSSRTIAARHSGGTNTLAYIGQDAVGNGVLYVNSNTNSDDVFLTGGTGSSYISSGSVGIGTKTPSASLHIYSPISTSTVLTVEGTSGVLFNVSDDLSDSLASINNQSGLPVAEFFNDNRVILGQFGQYDFSLINNRVGIGTNVVIDNFKLTTSGSIGPSTPSVFDLGSALYPWRILYGTASAALTASYITGSSNAWIEGGNSFGVLTSVFGTNDNSNIRINTNGTQRMIVGADGQVAIGSSIISAYTLTMGGHIGPVIGSVYDLGSTSSLWRRGYFNTISASTISASTLFGNLIGSSSYSSTASYVENAFIQNGNSFGTTAGLGTNDDQNLRFRTNGNTSRIIISSGSATRVGIGSNPELAYTLTVTGHVGPQSTNVYDLGATGSIWRNLYAGNISASNISSNFIGNLTGSAQSAVNAISASISISSSYAATASYIGNGTNNYLPKWSNNTLTATSSIIDTNGKVGIGTTNSTLQLNIAQGSLLMGRNAGDVANTIPGPSLYVSPTVKRFATDNVTQSVWYKFATSPSSSTVTGTEMLISFDGGQAQTNTKINFDLHVQTRDSVRTDIVRSSGDSFVGAGVAVYFDGVYNYYIKLTGGTFSAGSVMVRDGSWGSGSLYYDIIPGTPTDTSTPTGTLIFDSTDSTYYLTPGMFYDSSTNRTGIKTSTPATDLQVNGSFSATTKSFLIKHQTLPDKLLMHGSLEGPENGVYIRGRLKDSNVIELPDYWKWLIDENTITVNLTPFGKHQNLAVEKIENNKVYIKTGLFEKINCFYYVLAERKDVDKLQVII